MPSLLASLRAASKVSADDSTVEGSVEVVRSGMLLENFRAESDPIPAKLLQRRGGGQGSRRRKAAEQKKPDGLGLKLRRSLRLREIDVRLARILTDEDLDTLWEVLQDNSDEVSGKMSYDMCCQARKDAARRPELRGRETNRYFTPDIFARFVPDDQGRVSVETLFQHLELRVRHETNWLHLAKFDLDCDGTLTEDDIERFIRSLVPELPGVCELRGEDLDDYVIHASSRFFYLLDLNSRGRIILREAAHGPVTHEVADLRLGKVKHENELRNWFTLASYDRVRDEFRDLDVGNKGYLTQKELEKFRDHDITPIFVRRIFETVDMGPGGKFGYKQWVDFVLMQEWRYQGAGLMRLWRCIDIQQRGFLTVADLNMFFREMNDLFHSQSPPITNILTEDVVGEVFDMTKPKDPYHIRLEDIKAEGKIGWTSLAMLVSSSAFWSYENRESQDSEE